MTESIQMIAQVASTALISSIWQGAVLAAMIWLCLKLAPRTSANVRFNIWSAVFVATARCHCSRLLPVMPPSLLRRLWRIPAARSFVWILAGRWASLPLWAVFAADGSWFL